MTEPEQPEQPQLTRKQMRQIRNTASNPIITPGADAAAPAAEPAAPAQPDAAVHAESPAPPVIQSVPAPLPRAAEPVDVAPAPAPDSSIDLGVSPLTRRQARQQERIRTASVPVITPDLAAAHAEPPRADVPVPAPQADVVASAPVLTDGVLPESVSPEADSSASAQGGEAAASAPSKAPKEKGRKKDKDKDKDGKKGKDATPEPATEADLDALVAPQAESDDERATVDPSFGAELLSGQPVAVTTPPSFDQLLTRASSTTGSTTSANALILSQTPEGTIMGPVTATGEVLVTGTFALPDGLGSQGHAPGTADGHEVDAVLVDGELPAHSSPTPIAASAAISTVKTTGEIIRPPAPEKGSRLMLWLAITAGALALALVGVLVFAVATGVFTR